MQKLHEGSIDFFTDKDIFFNTDAELVRDISVAALAVFQKQFGKPISVCDALSATGIRGLRYAKEISGVKEVLLNDSNPIAVRVIKKNILKNKLQKICKANWSDANKLFFSGRVFHFIDLDPFGSPAQFLDGAARAIFHKGFVGITATDTAALCGSKPFAGLRKYGLFLRKTDFYQELGLRALITFSTLTFAKWDRAFVPVISFSHKHYYRIFGKIAHAGEIEKLLKQIDFVSYCRKCANRKFSAQAKSADFAVHKNSQKIFIAEKICDFCGSQAEILGPIYLGKINEKEFCSAVSEEIKKRNFKSAGSEIKLLRSLAEESSQPFYYELNLLCKLHKKNSQPTEKIISNLEKKNFSAQKTYLCPTAIRTSAGLKEVLESMA